MAKEVFVTVQPITGEPVYIEVQQDYAPVQAVNGRIGWITLDKSDVGLSNVENISISGVSGYLQYQIDNIDTGYASQAEINLLSGLLGQTGSYLYTTITNLSGDIVSNYATKIELNNTGSFLYNLINALSGYGNGAFATITNLAVTGSSLNNKINNLSGYTNNTFATISNLATTGQSLQNQINNLDLNYASQNEFNSLSGNLSSTGANLQSQISSLYSSGFLTGVDLSPYYLKSNPSGFITGVDLSNYATKFNLESTGQNLQNQIDNLDNVYATDSSLAQTGQFLDQKIDAFSGTYQNFVNNLDSNYASQSEFNTFSGNLNSTGQNLNDKINSLSGAAVLVYGDQTISGVKNFIDKPRYQNSQIYIDGGINNLSVAENQIVYVPQFDNYNAYNVTVTLVYISSSGLLRLPTGVHNLSTGQEQRLNIRLTGPGMAGGTFYIQNPNYGFVSGILSIIGWQNIYQTKVIDYTSVINLYKNSNNTAWQLDKNYSITNLENQSQYFVNTTGNQAISGTKIFRDQVYIKDLYVTGTQTIVNTTNTNVGSNYILLNATGGAIDAGIFIVTGNGLTGISDIGAVIGYDVPANRWVFGNTSRDSDLSQLEKIAGITDITNYSGFVNSNFYSINNPSGFITGIDLSSYATVLNLELTGQNLQSQLNNKANLTDIYNAAVEWTANHTLLDGTRYLAGDLVYVSGKIYKANFDNESIPVTSALYWTDLGNGYRLNIDGRDIPNIPVSPAIQLALDDKYSINNPSGFITGVDLSQYVTKSGGQFLDRPTLNGTGFLLSGEAASLPDTIVYTTGDQTISGSKTFAASRYIFSGANVVFVQNTGISSGEWQFSNRPTVNGTGIILSGEAYPSNNPSGYITGIKNIVFTTGNQTISGLKDFVTRPTVNTVPVALSGEAASNIEQLVKNDYGSTLYKGQPVYVSGSNGNNILIHPASNSGEGTSSKTFGLLKQTLLNNEQGYVVTEGPLFNVDTSMATEGDPVWLGPTGNLIFGLANKPKAPQHLVSLGFVERAHQNQGKIFVKVQNGFELEELHNVRIVNEQNSDIIIYNSGSGLWLNSGVNFGSFAAANDLATTGAALQANIDSLSGVSVLTFGNQIINGTKYFNENVYIHDLYVTGTEFIANVQNNFVESPYILLNLTGGAIDGGIFFVTGAGLTGVNDYGPIIGFDHSNKFKFGVARRSDDLSTLNDIQPAMETRQHNFYSTSTYTLAHGRNVQLNVGIQANGATGTIVLPRLTTDSAQNGDDLVIVAAGFGYGQTLIIERYIWTGSSYINSKIAVVTTTTAGSWRFRLLNGVWELQPVATHTHSSTDISDSTTAGRALLAGASAAAQRTSLGLGTAATSASTDFYSSNNPSGFITGVDLSSYYTNNNPSGFITGIDLSSYITGAVVRPSETGNFITTSQTGNFYSASNPNGYITGIDLSSYYTNDNPSGFITGVDLSSYVTASQTGSFYTNDNPSGFITGLDTSIFYTKDNPSGFITGIDISSFYPSSNPSGFITGVNLSNYVTGSVVRPEETGNFYTINNPSGFITGVNLSNYVTKTNGEFANRPTVNGTGILLIGEAGGGGTVTLPDTIVYTTGNQIISGTKNFTNVTETFLRLNIINQTVDFPLNSGMNFILPLTTGITGITFSNVPSNIYSFTLRVDYSGAHAIVWPVGFGGVLWPGNTAPTLTTTVGREDFFSFLTYTSGQEFFGFNIGQNYSGIY